MKKLVTLFLTLFVASSVWAANKFIVDGINYSTLNADAVEVKSIDGGYSGDIVIPSSVTYDGKEYDVTSIGSNAFAYCSGLTSVTIPNSVTSIGSWAFCDCSGLTSITIPNSVTSIGACAFFANDCPIFYSGSAEGRPWSAEAVYGAKDENFYYEDAEKNIISKYVGNEGDVVIPNGVTSIGDYAFFDCSSLTSVTIPNSVTSIGDYAFYDCSSLTSVTIPNSVTSIGNVAFSHCSSLTSVTIPNSVTSIGNVAFAYCSGLTSVTIPNSVISIGDYAFYECSGLTSVTIPNSVTSIGEAAFYYCELFYSGSAEGRPWGAEAVYGAKDENFYYEDAEKNIISKYVGNGGDVVIPNGVTSIGENVFSECSSLTSVTIPNSVTSIGENAFNGWCTIIYSGNVEGSPWGARAVYGAKDEIFYYEDAEKTIISKYIGNGGDVVIPNGVTSIKSRAFYHGDQDYYNLTSITIPNSVTSIDEDAFMGYYGLTSVTMPDGLNVTNAGLYIRMDNISYHVMNGKEVSVTRIYGYTVDIIIPSTITAGNSFTVTSIEDYALGGCTISSIIVPDNLDISNSGISRITKDGIYYNVIGKNEVSVDRAESSLTEVNIPNTITVGLTFGVTTIEGNAFSQCTNLKSVSIPSSVTKVEENAFSGCTALKNVTCLPTVPPTAYANSFENYNGYLYIPCESIDDYDFASCWGSFKHVECIGSETVELTKDEVSVVPEKTEAVFSMPKNENANTYTLTIQNNGVTFCTLTFNAQGQLANIDFSTTKSYELKSDVAGFQFTVTGLSTASDYGYSFKALASNKSVLKEYSGSFSTKNEDGTGGSTQGGGEVEGSGQGGQGGEGGEGGSTAISEASNATAVTIVNGQILVNGEAPAFVVTVSGQKIANANLKAGVYFVVADGESVGVSVR